MSGGAMTRRLSLAGQLLALQVVIILVVLVGVTAVTVAQSTTGAEQTEGRRAQAVAETLANSRALRDAVAQGTVAYIRVAAETTRTNSGSASVVVARPDRFVLASADPSELRRRYDVGESTVLPGRRWGGDPRLQRPAGRGGDGPDPGRAAPRDRRVRGRDPAVSDGDGRVACRRTQPAHLPRPGQRDRHRRVVAGGPAGEAADPRPGAAGDHRAGGAPRRDAARHPRGRGGAGPAGPGDPHQRRGHPAAAHPR